MKPKQRSKLLIATRPRGVESMTRALSSEFDLVFCQSMAEAQDLLEHERFDLIGSGTNFDDSRMFDLLRYVKAQSSTKSTPFVCIKVRHGILPPEAYETIAKAVILCGAAAFIDYGKWVNELGEEDATQELCRTLHQIIAGSIRK